ncbi:MAG: ATP-binding protein [Succinivibrionaceae bacterium]|nr:ATP-binding protein [Succinivibrionaceae bacterium]
MNGIPLIPDELLLKIRQGQNCQVECQEAGKELPKGLFDTVSSFSNREGGDIFLGVHDSGVISGVDPSCAAKLITEFGNLANNKDKLFPPTYLAAVHRVHLSFRWQFLRSGQERKANSREGRRTSYSSYPHSGKPHGCASQGKDI